VHQTAVRRSQLVATNQGVPVKHYSGPKQDNAAAERQCSAGTNMGSLICGDNQTRSGSSNPPTPLSLSLSLSSCHPSIAFHAIMRPTPPYPSTPPPLPQVTIRLAPPEAGGRAAAPCSPAAPLTLAASLPRFGRSVVTPSLAGGPEVSEACSGVIPLHGKEKDWMKMGPIVEGKGRVGGRNVFSVLRSPVYFSA